VALACTPAISPPSESPDGEHVLLQPRGNEVALLGLAVTEDPDGQLVIAEARAPGCRVISEVVPTQWERHSIDESGRVGVFRVGYDAILGIRAQYNAKLRVEVKVSNSKEIRARLEGPCGEQVIVAVFIGTGERSLQYLKAGDGSVSTTVGPVGIGAGGGGWRNVERSLLWSTPQAWGFRVGSGNSKSELIRIQMPTVIPTGTAVAPTIEVHEPLWLIVLYEDSNGDYGVIFPSPDLAAYRVPSGGEVELPSIIFKALPGHERDYERLLVYGFREELDFEVFRPRAGRLSPERANAYATELDYRLRVENEIPPDRWASTTFDYIITAGN